MRIPSLSRLSIPFILFVTSFIHAFVVFQQQQILAPNPPLSLDSFDSFIDKDPASNIAQHNEIFRRPDHFWDKITSGASLHPIFNENGLIRSNSEQLTPNLSHYYLRSKNVPSNALGLPAYGPKQMSGYLDNNATDTHLFYWFFESRNDPANDPIILWLNGGPGCSSMLGALMELGPLRVTESLKLEFNEFGWNANASVLFLDQPVQTGFSYGKKKISSSDEAAVDSSALLELFFHQNPQYRTQKFHIAGESYAGHYIPELVDHIVSNPYSKLSPKSMILGNGLTSPIDQYPSLVPMSCGEGGFPPIMSPAKCKSFKEKMPPCETNIRMCYATNLSPLCFYAFVQCSNLLNQHFNSEHEDVNIYDIRMRCPQDSFGGCYPIMDWITTYLNQKSIQDVLGVERKFQTCNMNVNQNFILTGDFMKPKEKFVARALEKMPVLIYAGEADLICNWMGNKLWTEKLEWPGKVDFNQSPYTDLKYKNNANVSIGQIRHSDKFAFVKLSGAGHMVPYDQPRSSLDLINRWMSGEFATIPQ